MSCGGGYALHGRVNTICGVESQGSRGWWWRRRLYTLRRKLLHSCDFSVSPCPFGLDFGTLDFGLELDKSFPCLKFVVMSMNVFNRL